MNKKDIISAVSIEFGLSKVQAEKTVDSIFLNFAQTLKKNKVLEIQKFGKFRLSADKDSKSNSAEIKFSPSKKLSVRVNGKFDNLKKVKVKFGSAPEVKENLKVVSGLTDNTERIIKPETSAPAASKYEKENIPVQRKLISEDLVKLHKEITKDKNDEPSADKNLWG